MYKRIAVDQPPPSSSYTPDLEDLVTIQGLQRTPEYNGLLGFVFGVSEYEKGTIVYVCVSHNSLEKHLKVPLKFLRPKHYDMGMCGRAVLDLITVSPPIFTYKKYIFKVHADSYTDPHFVDTPSYTFKDSDISVHAVAVMPDFDPKTNGFMVNDPMFGIKAKSISEYFFKLCSKGIIPEPKKGDPRSILAAWFGPDDDVLNTRVCFTGKMMVKAQLYRLNSLFPSQLHTQSSG